MPPTVALILTLGLTLYLFWRDYSQKPNVTPALWVPVIWMFIIGSRFISQWLDIVGVHLGGRAVEEGSPLDALLFFALIVSGLTILSKRRVRLATLTPLNRWLAIYLVYCLVSVLWSDFPIIAFKRWIKILGHPIMALVVLTEPDPEEALTSLLKRFTFSVIPLSITFIKYFPELGRGFDSWTGQPFNTGVTNNKNTLGSTCLVAGFYVIWHLLKVLRQRRMPDWFKELAMALILLGMVGWLIKMADSKTSLMAFLVASGVAIVLSLPWINKRYFGAYLIVTIVVIAVAQEGFSVYENLLRMLGRNPTLTDRTEVWHDVLEIPNNPLFGTGFESFWLGDRLKILWTKWPWQPNQAHNGYIETYVNLGAVGLLFLSALILSTFFKIQRQLQNQFRMGQFRMGLLLGILVYNYTEAAFKALHIVFFMFFLIALNLPKRRVRVRKSTERLGRAEFDGMMAPATSGA